MRGSRTLTVLFTDVVGSTDLLGRVGQKRADEMRAVHFGGMRGALAVHRGDEVKTLGDGFMASFASSVDAVACAVTMQQAAAQAAANADEGIEIRIGIAAGDVTEESGDYYGMSVVAASRLCAAAAPGQILATDVVRLLVGSGGIHRLEPVGSLDLKGIPEPVAACEVRWETAEDACLRVALAEDSALLRQGVARVLAAEGIDVVLEVGDAVSLLDGLAAARPHVAVIDVRMPPTHTTEGLDAAERIGAEHPGVGVLVLSASLDPGSARRLLEERTEGVGYLLKDTVGDGADLAAAIRTVASGGSAIDPEVMDRLAAEI